MKTFILMWNPAISSYKLEQFQEELEHFYNAWFNWSIWDYKEAHDGDRFFMVRCGQNGNRGICMSGHFTSDPYEGEDWSGRGRKTFYIDLDPDVMINSEVHPILTQEVLMKEIPEFDWTGGHSGRLLDEQSSAKLESLWSKFLDEHKDLFHISAFRKEISQDE